MIKRISLLMVAALMAAMMMVATAAPAFANPPGTTGKGDDPGTFTKDAKQQSHECVTGPGGSGKFEANTNKNGNETGAKCA